VKRHVILILFSHTQRGGGAREGGCSPCQTIFDDLILKLRILMHISGILLSPPGEGLGMGLCLHFWLLLISWRHEKTAALHGSPQNNAFVAILVQFW